MNVTIGQSMFVLDFAEVPVRTFDGAKARKYLDD